MHQYSKIDNKILEEVYKERDDWSHKGQYGKLVVVAGSYRHTGSPIFVGISAYKAGCDLVYLIGPERAMDIAASYSPLLITEPLKGKFLSSIHVKKVLDFVKEVRATALVIGNGLWRKMETKKAILKIIKSLDLPMVIDADAIRALALDKSIVYRKKCVITPHDNEFLELTKVSLPRNDEELEKRIEIVREESCKINCVDGNRECDINPSVVMLVKGKVDIITNGKEVFLNYTGNKKMTVGGMGDTLAGICGALLARNVDQIKAASAAAYINGLAGELAIKKYGESTITTDLINEIPNALKK